MDVRKAIRPVQYLRFLAIPDSIVESAGKAYVRYQSFERKVSTSKESETDREQCGHTNFTRVYRYNNTY
jgi:hypothetical protein